MKQWVTRRMALMLLLMFTLTFISPLFVLATSLDDLNAIQEQQEEYVDSSTTTETPTYENNVVEQQNNSAIADYLRGYTPVTTENMQFANETMSPVVKLIGNLTGCVMVFTTAAIFLVTALDLCYIGVPFTRAFLNPQYVSGVQSGGMPMGGGMGMGMRGGMGMMGGMGGMGGQPGTMPEHGLRRKWVSDEAVNIVAQFASQPMGPNAAMGGMGGMGGMGMMGGMGGMGGQPMVPPPTKIVIFEYFKRRTVFLIIFAVASVLLLSSVFTDCGINIAALGVKIMDKINGKILEVNV